MMEDELMDLIFLVQASEGWAPMPWMAMMLCEVSWGRLCLRREEEKEGRKDKRFTQSKLHSLHHLFHPREL